MFDIQKYLDSSGREGIDKTPEGIKEAATALLSGKYDGLFSNVSYKDWAQTALKALNEPSPDGTYFGGDAYSWITGAMQPTKARSVFGSYKTNLQEFQQSYQNAAENLANITDFSKVTPEQQAKILESDTYKQALAKVQSFEEQAKGYLAGGIQVATPTLTKDANGNYSSTLAPATQTLGAQGRLGEPVKIGRDADGTFSIVGANSGKVYESGFKTEAEYNARATELQSGAKPNVPGAFDTSATAGGTTTPSTGYRSSILDSAGVNTTGLTETEIKDLEAVYQNAGNSTDVMNRVFSMQEVTADDTKKFLDQAREFITGKGSAYEQSFTRARENYERTLENNALNRQAQMEQEKLALQQAQEQNATGAADAGLAFSGIRAKAEAKTAEQAANIAESSRRAFNFDVGTYSRGVEEQIGSANLAGAKLPAIQGVDNPTLTPGIRGSLERSAESDTQAKADELQAQSRAAEQEILAAEGGTTLY